MRFWIDTASPLCLDRYSYAPDGGWLLETVLGICFWRGAANCTPTDVAKPVHGWMDA